MAEITKNHVFTALGVVAALGFGYFKFQDRSTRAYTEANDPIVFIESTGPWTLIFQNTGPATNVVSFYWSPTNQNVVWCELQTYFSADERREINNPCPEFHRRHPEEAQYTMAVLTKEQFDRSNWRQYFIQNPPD